MLIYGAGDAGDLIARELLNNSAHDCIPVGFADDDPRKQGKVIQGLRVFGGNGSLRAICEAQQVDEVLISSMGFSEDRVEEIARVCEAASVTLRRMRIEIEEVTFPAADHPNTVRPPLTTVASAG